MKRQLFRQVQKSNPLWLLADTFSITPLCLLVVSENFHHTLTDHNHLLSFLFEREPRETG